MTCTINSRGVYKIKISRYDTETLYTFADHDITISSSKSSQLVNSTNKLQYYILATSNTDGTETIIDITHTEAEILELAIKNALINYWKREEQANRAD
uniref:Uncharacterized protein n=1 Tax=viral metagenome TaxID=1070528 RepID=A0A6C0JNR6_9ZZZZ